MDINCSTDTRCLHLQHYLYASMRCARDTHKHTYTQFTLLFYALKAIDDTSMMYRTISSVLFSLFTFHQSLALSSSCSLILSSHSINIRRVETDMHRSGYKQTHTHTRTHRGALSRFFGKLYQLIQFLLFYPTSMTIKGKYWHWKGSGKNLDSIWVYPNVWECASKKFRHLSVKFPRYGSAAFLRNFDLLIKSNHDYDFVHSKNQTDFSIGFRV